MFEPFKAASGSAKLANGFIFLFLFLSWVSTMVTFGDELHHVAFNNIDATGNFNSGTLYFYWDHWRISGGGLGVDGEHGNYNDVRFDIGGSCKSGGDATLAFAIFAFLAFLVHIPLAFSRMAGLHFPLARDTQHSLYIELVLSCVEFFCFFLQTTIWGGTCYSPTRSASGFGTVTGVGYGLIIACFFFLIINTVLYFMMRSNDNLVLGNGATRGGGGSAYSGDGGGDYGGGGDSASQPSFSYQGGGGETHGDAM